MAAQTKIKVRRSNTTGNVPTTGDLADGELALNTYDGKLFFKKINGASQSIVTLQSSLTAGTGVTISNNQINIGQDVSTSATPTFLGATLNGVTAINESGNGPQNTLTVAGSGSGSVFAVGVTDVANDGVTLKSLTSNLSNPAKLTLSGSSVVLKAGTKELTFNNSGNIVLPPNGDIVDSNNVSVLKFPTVKQVTFDRPISDFNGDLVYTNATSTNGSNNQITIDDSSGFTVGDPVTFSIDHDQDQAPFGDLLVAKIYYIKNIIDGFTIILSDSQDLSTEYTVSTDSGSMVLNNLTLSSYQLQRAPRQWTNYDSLETTGYDFSSLTFGDTYYDDNPESEFYQHIFIYANLGRGYPEALDITVK